MGRPSWKGRGVVGDGRGWFVGQWLWMLVGVDASGCGWGWVWMTVGVDARRCGC